MYVCKVNCTTNITVASKFVYFDSGCRLSGCEIQYFVSNTYKPRPLPKDLFV